MRASSVSAPTLSARITSAPVPFRVAPIDAVAGLFSTGIGSPVTIDSSTRARALEHDAVDRHLLARAHAQPVADVHVLERHVLVGAVVADAPRGLRREAEERLDGGAGAAARAELEHLAEQDERHDHRRRLEVDARPRRACRGTSREDAGRERRDHAVGEATQTPRPISVNMFRLRFCTRLQARTKNGQPPQSTTGVASTSSTQGARCGAGMLERMARKTSIRPSRRTSSGSVSAKANPEAARMSASSGFVRLPRRGEHRLERHAADRARARADRG